MKIIAAAYILSMESAPLADGALAIDGERIVAVGTRDYLRRCYTAPVEDHPECVIMPGLINAHTHLELTHFPAWRLRNGMHYSPRNYVDWIIQVIKIKRGLEVVELAASLMEGLKISLQSGTTMVGDFLSDRRLLPYFENAELSGRIYLEFIGQSPERYHSSLAAAEDDIHAVPAPFLAGLAPHAPFTVARDFLRDIMSLAEHKGLPLAMHLSESVAETDFFHNASGAIVSDLFPYVGWRDHVPEPLGISATEWLETAGVLNPNFHAVHGVHLTPADIAILKKKGCPVVIAPRSNETLAVGTAPIDLLRHAEIPLAIGTDSLASNNSLSLWDEMRFLLDSHSGNLTPQELLKMATINGARAIRRETDAGSLTAGKRADFLVVKPVIGPDPVKIYEQLLEDARIMAVWSGGKRILSA